MTTDPLCAGPNPWDNRIHCQLPAGHNGRHEADGPIRWDDLCHFLGDDCPPTHHDTRRTA